MKFYTTLIYLLMAFCLAACDKEKSAEGETSSAAKNQSILNQSIQG